MLDNATSSIKTQEFIKKLGKTISDLKILLSISSLEKDERKFNMLHDSISSNIKNLNDQINNAKLLRKAIAEEYLSLQKENPNNERLKELKIFSLQLQRASKALENLSSRVKAQLFAHAAKAPSIDPTQAVLKDAPKVMTIDPVTAIMRDLPKAPTQDPEFGAKIKYIIEKINTRERHLAYREVTKEMKPEKIIEFNQELKKEIRNLQHDHRENANTLTPRDRGPKRR